MVIQNCIIFIIKQCSSFTLVNLRSRGGPSAPPSIIPSRHVVLTEKCEGIEDTRGRIEGREMDRRLGDATCEFRLRPEGTATNRTRLPCSQRCRCSFLSEVLIASLDGGGDLSPAKARS